MARFGARCSPTAAPQRIRNKARFARLRGGVPTDQLRDAQSRKTAWQDRDEDRERQLSSHLAIRVVYWRCFCADMSANGMVPLRINSCDLSCPATTPERKSYVAIEPIV